MYNIVCVCVCVCLSNPLNEFSTNLPSLRIGHSILIYKGKGQPTKNLNWSIATGKFEKVYCLQSLQGRP